MAFSSTSSLYLQIEKSYVHDKHYSGCCLGEGSLPQVLIALTLLILKKTGMSSAYLTWQLNCSLHPSEEIAVDVVYHMHVSQEVS